MLYFVIELQTIGDQGGVLSHIYANKDDALSKFYELAAIAVKSTADIHTIQLVTSDGFTVVKPVIADHREKPEPEA